MLVRQFEALLQTLTDKIEGSCKMAKLISDTLSHVVHQLVVLIICVLTVKQCSVLRDTDNLLVSHCSCSSGCERRTRSPFNTTTGCGIDLKVFQSAVEESLLIFELLNDISLSL